LFVTAHVTDQQLSELFTEGCDPYEVAARALFGGPSPDVRDLVKRVFMHVAAQRAKFAISKIEPTLRRAADLFHEVGSAIAADDLLPTCKNEILAGKLRENVRSRDQVKHIAADGFELCVLALADLGAKDVTVHECGRIAFGEEPWDDRGIREDVTKIPMSCTGTLVHDEFTPCPVHDHDRRNR
jgi:hypothetical protein